MKDSADQFGTRKSAEERRIFTVARGISDRAGRESYLSETCGADSELRARVEKLLAAREKRNASPLGRAVGNGVQPDHSAQRGAIQPEEDDTAAETIDIASHPLVDRYKLLEQIGHGGMGTVYMAQQTEPVRRKVAVKIINPGMNSREVLARFEAERQALALMDHPNIASVFDGGTTDKGLPYFVMELVRGIPLTDFCLEKKLTLNQRLKLFMDVCGAVQHAHQKGIIHRDLKPKNIMVTMHDDEPVVKVIDFGVAKALNQDLTDKTLFTKYSSMIGTPLYMSPEQAQMSGLDVDTRSDIYSLGVILYELLTGTTPFEKGTLSTVGMDQFRKILSTEEPQRPSARVSTIKSGQRSAADDPRCLNLDPLGQDLDRDLDWVVMKALEKDRERRYESARAFANDVQRFLNNEPVEACPPSALYQLQKYARRNRGLLAVAALILVTMAVATGVSLRYSWLAHQAAETAEDEKEKAVSAQKESDANFSAALSAIDKLLEHATNSELAKIPQVQAIRRDILLDTLEFYQQSNFGTNPSSEIKYRIALVRTELAKLESSTRDPEKGGEQLLAVLKDVQAHLAEYPDDDQMRELAARIHIAIGRYYSSRYIRGKARVHFAKAYELSGSLLHLAFLADHDVSLLGEKARAVELLRKGLRELEDLPENTEGYQLIHRTMARALEDSDPQAAGRHYRLGIEAARRASSERYPGEKHGDCYLLENAALFFRDKNPLEAMELISESVSVRHQLQVDFPAITGFRRALQESVQHWFNCASSTAKDASSLYLAKRFREEFPAVFTNPVSYRGLALALSSRKDSIEAFDYLLTLYPRESSFYRYRGMAHSSLGEKRKSIEDLNRAVELLGDGDPGALLSRAKAYQDSGRIEEARADLNQYFEYAKPGEETYAGHRARGEFFLNVTEEYQKALLDFDATLTWRPEASHLYKRRALTHFHLGHFEQAKADLQKCIQFNPKETSEVWWIDAHSIATCGNREFQAWMLEFANSVVELQKRSAKSLFARAPLLAAFGKLQQAEQDLLEAIETKIQEGEGEKTNYQACYWAALLTAYSGKTSSYCDQCQQIWLHFSQSTKVIERYFAAWTIALAPKATDDYQAVIEVAEQICAKEPEKMQYCTCLGALYYRAGRFEMAREALVAAMEKADSSDSSPAYCRYFLALTHQALGDAKAARKQLAAANEIADAELDETPPWNRMLTLKLLRREAETTIAKDEEVSEGGDAQ